MKLLGINWRRLNRHHPRWCGGFTLVEMMISMTIFIMAIGTLMVVHIFGGRMYELSKAKLGASDEVRTSLAYLMDEVRTNDFILVGTGDISSFASAGDGVVQQGNAIQIYPTNSTSSAVYVRYYMDPTSFELKRISNTDVTAKTIVHAVTNYVIFSAQDAFGTVLTNNNNNRVISMFLQITQLYSPVISIQTGGLFDYYQIRAKATRRQL